MSAKGIKTKGGSGGREYPGGLVINGSPKQEPSPAIQSLPSGLGEPAAVIQSSPWRGSSAATTAAALCSSRPALRSVSPGESKVMSSNVTPSSPMHSPVCWANATTTSMLLRRSSKRGCSKCPYTRTSLQKLVIFGFRDLRCHWRSHRCHSSAPLALGDRRESIEPSRYQDFVWETLVTQVLNRTPALARLSPLICLQVRHSPRSRL